MRKKVVGTPLAEVGGLLSSARRSLSEIDEIWLRYVQQESSFYQSSVDTKRRRVVHTVALPSPLPFRRIGDLLRHATGDARSALDRLLYTSALHEGLEPRSLRNLQFPIVDHVNNWHLSASKCQIELLPEFVQRIQNVQPFRQVTPLGVPHPVQFLRKMSNSEKHQDGFHISVVAHPSAGVSQMSSFRVTLPTDSLRFDRTSSGLKPRQIAKIIKLNPGPFRNGDVVCTIKLPRKAQLETIVLSDFNLPVALAVELRSHEWNFPMLPYAKAAIHYVQHMTEYVYGLRQDLPDCSSLLSNTALSEQTMIALRELDTWDSNY